MDLIVKTQKEITRCCKLLGEYAQVSSRLLESSRLKADIYAADEAIKNGTTDEIMQSYKKLKEYKKRSKKL